MSDYDHQPKHEYRPTLPLETYLEFLRRNLGTSEQQKRYAEAVRWYNAQQQKINVR